MSTGQSKCTASQQLHNLAKVCLMHKENLELVSTDTKAAEAEIMPRKSIC